MSFVDAKAAVLLIQKDLIGVIGNIIPSVCDAAASTSAFQFEMRAVRLQGFLLAYGAEAKVIDAISGLIVAASEDSDDEDTLMPPPESGIFALN